MTSNKPLLSDAELGFLIRMEFDEVSGFESPSGVPFAIVPLSEVAASWTLVVPFHVPYETRQKMMLAAEAVGERFGLLLHSEPPSSCI